jgi:hypothetical protein
MRQTIIVCISNINPMASGWFIWVNVALSNALAVISVFISGDSLCLKC